MAYRFHETLGNWKVFSMHVSYLGVGAILSYGSVVCVCLICLSVLGVGGLLVWMSCLGLVMMGLGMWIVSLHGSFGMSLRGSSEARTLKLNAFHIAVCSMLPYLPCTYWLRSRRFFATLLLSSSIV